MLRTLRSIVAAAALTTGLAAATIAVPAAPASAAACGTAAGVTVVVDPQQLGGGVRAVCDASGAQKTAASIFEESGFHQSYTSGGMVCQVNGQPSGDACRHDPPATAYWSLWWSDGTSGWVYSSLGVGSLKIPAGGSVAWTWQGQSAKRLPGVAPAKKVAAASAPAASAPTSAATKPKPGAAHQPVKRNTDPQVTPRPDVTASPSPSALPSAMLSTTPGASDAAKPKKVERTASATASASDAAVPSPSTTAAADAAVTAADSTRTAADSAESDGLPGWVPPAVIAVLALIAGAVALVRRRKV